MSGKRIKDITGEQTTFSPTLRVLVDKVDTGSNDWLLAKAMELSVIGNTYMQGSSNGTNWHDTILSTDTYFKFSTDGGSTYIPLTTANIREVTNLYYTEARVSANTDVAANTAVRHTHTNQSILDNIIDTGLGSSFLTDDGTYRTASEALPALISHADFNDLDYASAGHTGFAPALTADQNYVSDAELVVLQNTSGTNTNDETQATILSKLGLASISGVNTGDQDLSGLVVKVTGSSLVPDTEIAKLASLEISSYSITLPSAVSVGLRCSGAVEGTDYPTGWTVAAGTTITDLLITHNLTRPIHGVSIFSISGTGEERLLVPFNTAYTGILLPDLDSILVEGLTEILTEIRINILFV